MARHLTIEEREVISRMQASGHNQASIAKALGRDRSTVSRELARNSVDGSYRAVSAHYLAAERRSNRSILRKMDRPEIRDDVVSRLTKWWSPEQISGRLKAEHGGNIISHQTIYAWAKSDEFCDHWRQFLRHGGKKRRGDERRGRIKKQVTIENRPKIVDRRARQGDWEGDTVRGGNCKEVLVTLVERKTGFILVGKAMDRTAARVGKKIVDLYSSIDPDGRLTLTLDNGKEFASHQAVANKLDLSIYFARPYCSYERGTNENANGLLRQFIPKKTDLSEVSHQEIKRIADMMNNRPRKRLGYKTPAECFDFA